MKPKPILKRGLTALLLAIMAVACAAVGDEAQKPITLAVFKITGPHRTLANGVADLLTANLSADGRFNLVDRNQLDKVMAELELGQSGAVNPDTAARVGHLTGAQVLVTGREMLPNPSGEVVILVSVIGTETGREFSHILQGPRTNIVALVSSLSQTISDTILKESTNLIANAADPNADLLDKIIQQAKGRNLPSVSILIHQETAGGGSMPTAGNELMRIFQKAGFTILDNKSRRKPDVLITGDAVTDNPDKQGNLFACKATISVKAQERASGKILSLDFQRSSAVGVGDQTTTQQALQQAADELAQRLVPLLAK